MASATWTDKPQVNFDSGLERKSERGFFLKVLTFILQVFRFLGLLIVIGLGLLPLSSLLLFLPIISTNESVLLDTQSRTRNIFHGLFRRVFGLLTGLALLIALLAFSVQMVSALNLTSSTFGRLARNIFGDDLSGRLPAAMIEGWPYVLLLMYLFDIVILFFIGKVPLQYNLRNLRVRWVTTIMTGLAFTLVIALLTVMMGFVDSVNRLTAKSGIPGNVFILSEGATDELFSNLGYGDVGKIELEKAYQDKDGNDLVKPITVKMIPGQGGQPPVALASKETYFVVNQEIPNPTGKAKRRFVQLRGVDDALVAAKVHDIVLLKGEWFGREGSTRLPDGSSAVPCVLGEGAAVAFGTDNGKEKLDVGDIFMLGDLRMVVNGIMKSEGSTFGSETWATNARVSKEFGKQSFTTVVIRVSEDTNEAAAIMANHLSKNFANPRIRAVEELRYYEDLGKSNSQLLSMVVIVAVIMALGGVIGIMLVMFAAIAQRTKDIGVMRILGFKRWQVLVSFMLESLTIALIGGVLAILLILSAEAIASAFFGGLSITSNVSSGQGSGKTIVTKLVFGLDVIICGLVFTIIMGRLGGLVPSLSAMRLGILDSLK